MENKFKTFLAFSVISATAVTLALVGNSHEAKLANAQNPEYSVKWTNAARKEGANVIFKTNLGNEITFKTSNMVESDKMVSLGSKGTIENLPSKENKGIGQIKSISLDYTIDSETVSYNPANGVILGIEYGYQVDSEIKFIKTVDFEKTLNFNEGNYPSYIRIHNNYTGVVNFNEISLTYGCTSHDGYAAKDFTLTFDTEKEGLYDWSKVGTINKEDGSLTITKNAKVALDNPIVIHKNTPWTLQFKTKASATAPNGTILTEGVNSSNAFINLPDAMTNNRDANGFTIRDTNRVAGYLFKKDKSKVNDINTFVMTYDGVKSIHAYQNGVEIKEYAKQGSGSAKQIDLTFNYLFSGFYSEYDYIGTIYHLQYNTSVIPTSKFIK